MDFMRDKPDKYYDLAIVDPPYGINAPNMQMGSAPNRKGKGQYPAVSTAVKLKKGRLNGGSGKLKNRGLNMMNCDWDYNKPTAEYFKELFRISKNQIIWGGNYFDLPPTRGIICWDKLQPWDNFSQWEMAWTSFDKPAKMYRISNTGGANAEIKIHPTQKPVKLYRYQLLDYSTKKSDRILDTHGGSMSSAIACEMEGYDLDICEIDTDYFEAGVKRLNQYKQQQTLFKPEEIA
jgi:site-specific DNA-methyltransferase (adenine-specific)